MHEADHDTAAVRAKTWVGVFGGLLFGVLVGALASTLAHSTNHNETRERAADGLVPQTVGPIKPNPPELIDQFVKSWERYRSEEYVAVFTFRRTTTQGGELELPSVVVQAPPVRLSSNSLEIRDTNNVSTASVEAELKQLRSYVEGTLPLYRLWLDEGCFHLRLGRAIHTPPYGRFAQFCFEETTGVLSRLVIERDEGTDVLVLEWVRGEVRSADLEAVRSGQLMALAPNP